MNLRKEIAQTVDNYDEGVLTRRLLELFEKWALEMVDFGQAPKPKDHLSERSYEEAMEVWFAKKRIVTRIEESVKAG